MDNAGVMHSSYALMVPNVQSAIAQCCSWLRSIAANPVVTVSSLMWSVASPYLAAKAGPNAGQQCISVMGTAHVHLALSLLTHYHSPHAFPC